MTEEVYYIDTIIDKITDIVKSKQEDSEREKLIGVNSEFIKFVKILEDKVCEGNDHKRYFTDEVQAPAIQIDFTAFHSRHLIDDGTPEEMFVKIRLLEMFFKADKILVDGDNITDKSRELLNFLLIPCSDDKKYTEWETDTYI